MTRQRAPYLLHRYGTHFLRVRVPDELRERLGVTEVRRALRTSSFAQARLLALTYGTRLRRAFDHMIINDLSKEQCITISREIERELAKEADRGFVPQSNMPREERDEQRDMAGEFIASVLRELDAGQFSSDLLDHIDRLLGSRVPGLAVASTEARRDLTEGVARALVEQQRRYIFRLDEPLAEYRPTDPLFLAAPIRLETQLPHAQSTEALSSEPPGLTVDELVAEYTRAKAPEWTHKTRRTHTAKLRLFATHVGGSRRISTIAAHDIWSFRDGLLRLRRGYQATEEMSFASLQTDADDGQITAATATNILARIKSMFRWARQRHLCASDPAEGVQITQPKAKKGARSRRSFTASELRTLFAAPLFTGCKSDGRRFDAGTTVVRDAYFWLPILGLYTGARLGELVQLHFGDVMLDADVPHFSINEDDHGAVDHKHVKTDAGVRRVRSTPI